MNSPLFSQPELISGHEAGGSFAERIKILIQRVGSVTEIARRCGFSEGVVRSWRDGSTDPSRARCLKLSRTLGISLIWLVAGEGSMLTPDLEEHGSSQARDMNDRPREPRLLGSLSAPSTEMDPQRLSAAIRILQSELALAGSALDLGDHADLLAEIYAMLGPGGSQVNASAMLAFNHRLANRLGRMHC